MATCPMCNADMPDDQMDQHKTEVHPETGAGDAGMSGDMSGDATGSSDQPAA